MKRLTHWETETEAERETQTDWRERQTGTDRRGQRWVSQGWPARFCLLALWSCPPPSVKGTPWSQSWCHEACSSAARLWTTQYYNIYYLHYTDTLPSQTKLTHHTDTLHWHINYTLPWQTKSTHHTDTLTTLTQNTVDTTLTHQTEAPYWHTTLTLTHYTYTSHWHQTPH